MKSVACLCLAVLSLVTATASAAEFKLGLDYSQLTGGGGWPRGVATDAAGAVYILGAGDWRASEPGYSQPWTTSYVYKLAPSGDVTAYVASFPFQAQSMAVDGAGRAYLLGPQLIVRLNANGTGYDQMSVPKGLEVKGLAVDRSGGVYIAGNAAAGALGTTQGAFQRAAPAGDTSNGFIAKVDIASGTFLYATYLSGYGWDAIESVAVDATGSVFVTGRTTSADFPITPGACLTNHLNQRDPIPVGPFLARLSPDGSRLIYSSFTAARSLEPQRVVVDRNGNAVVTHAERDAAGVITGHVIWRFNPAGSSATIFRTPPMNDLQVDGAGNTYVFSSARNVPQKNNLYECSSSYLTVYGPSGEILQATYLPVPVDSSPSGRAVTDNSTVYVLGSALNNFVPTRTLAQGGLMGLSRLSPNANAKILPLACVQTGIAPGKIVTLFGEALGPDDGTQPNVDARAGFPTTLAGVQVTFDGIPAPLLYVQGGQINAIAPWSLREGRATSICVSATGSSTNCLSRQVEKAAVDVFVQRDGYAAALNQDGTVNSAKNPAPAGSLVSIFATGMGAINPPVRDGSIVSAPVPVHVLPTRIALRGYRSVSYETPRYAGPAPGLVAGVSQIQFPAEYNRMFLIVGEGTTVSYSGDFWIHVAPR